MTGLRRLLATLGLVAILSGIGLVVLPAPSAHAQILLGNQSNAFGKGTCVDGGKLDPANVAPCLDPSDKSEPWIFSVWHWSLSIINIFAVIVLIIMAFANIIYPWKALEPYRIRQLLPAFIWGIILANLSLFMCRAVVSLGDLLLGTTGIRVTLVQLFNNWGINAQFLSKGVIQAKFGLDSFVNSSNIQNANAVDLGTMLYQLLIATALVYLPIIAMLSLAAIFYLRFAVIFVLTAISPLAFGAIIFPATQKYLAAWWDTFWKWTFGGVASYLLLWMAAQVTQLQPSNQTAAYVNIIPYGISLFLVYLAIQAPWKLGGAIAAGYQRAIGSVGRRGQQFYQWGGKKWEQTRKDSIFQRGYGRLGKFMNRVYEKGAGRLADDDANFAAGGVRNRTSRWLGHFQKTVGGLYNKTNMYGLKEAQQRRREYDNGTYGYVARTKSGVYAAHLGEEAGIKFQEADTAERYRQMPLDTVERKLAGMAATGLARGGTTWENLTESEREAMLYGGFDRARDVGRKLGLRGAEDINAYKHLRRRQRDVLVQEERQRALFGLGGPAAGGGGPHGVPAAPRPAVAAAQSGGSGSRPVVQVAAAPAAGKPHGVPAIVAPNMQVVGQAAPAGGLGAAASTAAVAAELKHEGDRTGFSGGQPANIAGQRGPAVSPAAQASTLSLVGAMRGPIPSASRPGTAVNYSIPGSVSGYGSDVSIGRAPLGVSQLADRQAGPGVKLNQKPASGRNGSGSLLASSHIPQASTQQVLANAPATGFLRPSTPPSGGPSQSVSAPRASQPTRVGRAAAAIQQRLSPSSQAATTQSVPRPIITTQSQPAQVIGAAPGITMSRPEAIVGHTQIVTAPAAAAATASAGQAVRQTAAQTAATVQQRQAEQTIVSQAQAATPIIDSRIAQTRVGRAALAVQKVVGRGATLTKTAVGQSAAAVQKVVDRGAATVKAADRQVTAASQAIANTGRAVASNTLTKATGAINAATTRVAQTAAGQETIAAGSLMANAGRAVARGTLNKATAARTVMANRRTAKQARQEHAVDMATIQADLRTAARANPANPHTHLAQQYQQQIGQLTDNHHSISSRLQEVTDQVNRQLELAGYAGAKPHTRGFEAADEDLRREMMALTRQKDQTEQDIAAQQRRLAKLQGQPNGR